jgi:hypothetical protein
LPRFKKMANTIVSIAIFLGTCGLQSITLRTLLELSAFGEQAMLTLC